MKILKIKKNIAWLQQPNEMQLVVSHEMPPVELCTAAYVFAFDGDKMLMANLDRGIDIPGGHIDPGKSPEMAMRRETLEETGATIGAATLFCYQKITLKGPKPEGYTYPYPESYQVMYFSKEVRAGKFSADEDSSGPIFIDRNQAKNIPWLQENCEIYDYAFSLINKPAMIKELKHRP